MSTFIERHGLVKYSSRLSRSYACIGPCEIIVPRRNNKYNTHSDKFVFDHCHIHGWIRGIICVGCNIALGNTVDRHIYKSPPELIAHYQKCPECPLWEPWITQDEYWYGLIMRRLTGIIRPGFLTLDLDAQAWYLYDIEYRTRRFYKMYSDRAYDKEIYQAIAKRITSYLPATQRR